ncbi:MAG: beta-lactamase family protein [Cytophagaceae bacterium]|nr:beta-lactamase family protein [Cytophagaceae bacterium]
MSLLKKTSFLLGIAALGYGGYYGYTYASIGAGYAAKATCSCVFVSGRSLESVIAEDLYAVKGIATSEIDRVNRSATTRVLGIVSKTAVYREELGCTLLNGVTAEELRRQPKPTQAATAPDSLAVGETIPALQKTLDWTFAEPDPKRIVRTRAVLVLHRGKIVAERYAPGITANTPLTGWSMTKSVTNAMIGMLVNDGKLIVEKPAPIAEWQNDDRRQITLDNLLRMSSGLRFEENYGNVSDATKMLFLEKGAGLYAIKSPSKAKPGTEWYYSSGTTNILQEIIRRQFQTHAGYLTFPHQRLFQKIGMSSAVLEPDASGTYVGSSFLFATARDWARFGQLFAQDGVWNGERLLPEGWVSYSARETPHSAGRYAAQFWVYPRQWGLPADSFMANGFEGQLVLVVPSKQLVIVRLGCTPDERSFDEKRFLQEINAAVK